MRPGDASTYSICMLCSNDGQTVMTSVQSVLELSKYRNTEVVVVDNLSTDGSVNGLRELRDKGEIKLIEKSCTRGVGRQLAFEASKGDYILSHMDCDDIFDASGIDSLITRYHRDFEGKVLMTKRKRLPESPPGESNITIAPRTALNQIGGWRALNWGEDWDLWARLASVSLYSFLPYPSEDPPHKTVYVRAKRYSGLTRGFWVRVQKYADALRSGRRVFDKKENVSTGQRLALAVAKARVFLGGSTLDPIPNPDFHEDLMF